MHTMNAYRYKVLPFLNSSLIEIRAAAFQGCSYLREVVCIEGLPKFEYKTFSYCPALERITFPNISSRLEDIIRAGQVDVENKIQQYINQNEMIEWERGGTICIFVVEVTRRRFVDAKVARKGDHWDSVQQRLGRIFDWIRYYERKEATTIFELAMWKAKIDQVDDDVFRTRDDCRVDVPGPVKDSILQYLL